MLVLCILLLVMLLTMLSMLILLILVVLLRPHAHILGREDLAFLLCHILELLAGHAEGREHLVDVHVDVGLLLALAVLSWLPLLVVLLLLLLLLPLLSLRRRLLTWQIHAQKPAPGAGPRGFLEGAGVHGGRGTRCARADGRRLASGVCGDLRRSVKRRPVWMTEQPGCD